MKFPSIALLLLACSSNVTNAINTVQRAEEKEAVYMA